MRKTCCIFLIMFSIFYKLFCSISQSKSGRHKAKKKLFVHIEAPKKVRLVGQILFFQRRKVCGNKYSNNKQQQILNVGTEVFQDSENTQIHMVFLIFILYMNFLYKKLENF